MMNFENNNYNNDNYNNANESITKNKKSGKIFRKAIAYVTAIVLISSGSIGIYNHFTKDGSQTNLNTSAEVAQTTETTSNSSAISLSNTSASGMTTSQIAEKLMPSVVGIKSTFTYNQTQNNNSMYGFGFGSNSDNSQSSSQDLSATGTGIVYSTDGYIVTNAHVIYDEEYTNSAASSVTVVTNYKKEYDASIVAYDTEADIAVLKVNATGLTAAKFGDSDSISVGDSVVAIGNPLGLDLFNTVTSGIISGLNRNITINDTEMTLIQTDAAINSGNSGGPLINANGEVIGINSSKMSSNYSQTSIEGIGFAIPSDYAQEVISDLINYGYVTGRAQIGISCQDISESIAQNYNMPVGVYVISVSQGSCAEKAGLQQGDVITAVNGEEISTYAELKAKKKNYKSGDKMNITINRNGQEMQLPLTLDEESPVTSSSSEAVEG